METYQEKWAPAVIRKQKKQSSLERTLISAAQCRKIRLHIVAIDFCATKDETLVHFERVNQLDGNLWFEQLGGLGEGFARIGRHRITRVNAVSLK